MRIRPTLAALGATVAIVASALTTLPAASAATGVTGSSYPSMLRKIGTVQRAVASPDASASATVESISPESELALTSRLLWTHHHLILDGWSLPIVLRDVMAYYRETAEGIPHPLPPPIDYAACMRRLSRRDAAAAEAVRESFWLQGMMAGLPAAYFCIKAFSETDMTEDLKKIEVPTLLLHGDADQIVPIDDSAKLSAKLLKNCQLQVIPGAPHGMCTTHKDLINERLLAFFQK